MFKDVQLCLAGLMLLWVALPAAGQSAKKPRVFESWGTQCEVPEGADQELCYAFQRVNVKESGKTILHITVAYPPKQENVMLVLTLPLGVSLIPGVEIMVDETGRVFRAPYSVCLPNGCRATFGLDPKQLWALKAGNQLQVAFANSEGRALKLPVSLAGFTEAINHVKASRKQ